MHRLIRTVVLMIWKCCFFVYFFCHNYASKENYYCFKAEKTCPCEMVKTSNVGIQAASHCSF